MSVQTLPLPTEWQERLGVAERRSPEFYDRAAAVLDTPHALAIRTAFDELGLSGIFCVQGVPTIAFLNVAQFDPTAVVDIHGALWNQGLASLLLVIAGDTLRAYSLARKPQEQWGQEFDQRCLIDTFNATADALKIRNLIYGAESGRIWKEHADFFRPKERIDQVLLDNLTESHKLLSKTLSSDAAQALLIQTMFIGYLEDREIITPEYFRDATRGVADSFSSLLAKNDVKLLKSLFITLRDDFNGNLFVAPCSFDSHAKAPPVREEHLDVLASFRSGREEMAKSGQYRFWGYDFRFIPIELVSAVYDRFLGEREEDRKAQGAYYTQCTSLTPSFLSFGNCSRRWSRIRASFSIRHAGRGSSWCDRSSDFANIGVLSIKPKKFVGTASSQCSAVFTAGIRTEARCGSPSFRYMSRCWRKWSRLICARWSKASGYCRNFGATRWFTATSSTTPT